MYRYVTFTYEYQSDKITTICDRSRDFNRLQRCWQYFRIPNPFYSKQLTFHLKWFQFPESTQLIKPRYFSYGQLYMSLLRVSTRSLYAFIVSFKSWKGKHYRHHTVTINSAVKKSWSPRLVHVDFTGTSTECKKHTCGIYI